MNCPGSIAAEAAVPKFAGRGESFAASEGTSAHEASEVCLKVGLNAERLVGRHFYGVEITVENADYIQQHLDYCRKEIAKAGKDALVLLEERFSSKPFGRGDSGGTADVTICEPWGTLKIIDLKFGKGIMVEVESNEQLMIYGACALMDPRIYDMEPQDVEITIHQPRKNHERGPIRTYKVTAKELLWWAWNVYRPAMDATDDPDAPRVAGDHCTWCDAIATCPENHEYSMHMATMAFPDEDQAANEEEYIAKLVEMAKAVPVLDARSAAIIGAIDRVVMGGRKVPGKKLVRMQSRRKWYEEDEETAVLKLMAKLPGSTREDFVETKETALGPRPIENSKSLRSKGFKPKTIKAAVTKLCHAPPGGLTVADESDSRPEVVVDYEEIFPD